MISGILQKRYISPTFNRVGSLGVFTGEPPDGSGGYNSSNDMSVGSEQGSCPNHPRLVRS